MRYELSPYPPSILFRTIKSYEATSHVIPQTERYMLVGGSLLHKLKWTRGDTYGKIANTLSVTFGGESTCSLAAVCYGISMKKVTSAKSFLLPERFTPTDSATKFHMLRCTIRP